LCPVAESEFSEDAADVGLDGFVGDYEAPQKAVAASGGRSVDAGAPNRRRVREEKELKSSNFGKPSDGLEPSTPSLPWRWSGEASGNGLRLSSAILTAVRLRRASLGCVPSAPQLLHESLSALKTEQSRFDALLSCRPAE
jgi:hypothetical protein